VKHEYIDRLNEAIRLLSNEEYEQALFLLDSLHLGCPEEPAINAYLGWVHLQKHNLSAAIKYARNATLQAPRAEKASLVLFHSLLRNDQVAEAISELLRFAGLTSSSEYGKLLSDLVTRAAKQRAQMAGPSL
jgi:predicted Zn-dependent protease